MRKFEYLVSFDWRNGKATGNGFTVVDCDRMIKTSRHIEKLKKHICKENSLETVVVINFQLLRTKYFG